MLDIFPMRDWGVQESDHGVAIANGGTTLMGKSRILGLGQSPVPFGVGAIYTACLITSNKFMFPCVVQKLVYIALIYFQ